MIIVAIIALSLVVLGAITAVLVNIPPIPADVMALISTALGYFNDSIGFVLSFFQPAPIKAMIAISVTLHLVYDAYRMVMWVATKIPMLGVSDE